MDVERLLYDEYGHYLLERLIETTIVCEVYLPNHNASAFDVIEHTTLFAWYISSSQRRKLIEEMNEFVQQNSWPAHWIAQLPKVIFSLALAECKAFYDLCIKQKNLPCLSQSSTDILTSLLQEFSVAHCHRIIYDGAQMAANLSSTPPSSINHTVNYMIDACLSQAEQVRSKNGVPPVLERTTGLPRSMISHVLYDAFLNRDEDDGFNLPLSQVNVVAQQ